MASMHNRLTDYTSCLSDLERAVEELSELIESPLDPDSISTLRQKVTDKTVRHLQYLRYLWRYLTCVSLQVYVQKRNEIVLEDTAKGFQEGRWAWNSPVPGFD